ncbi:glycerol acyltransferase [Mycolicibacterium madagascariense]|uniref:Glycerol acyltransferase n=1 Tax=Mycolicibacterium madagascariense TaxID=212765 RepID=A0A7I7XPB6_9MYCO|nr:lysophospholipid acyltransferase family protein [Mycolicibacterium madagascariense]MCV7014076.1 acyltransferase family protein [Mycolicibacterium madagascariense]BBZ31101.1 glycerol acyltransferase [Mycolicibacterium madagascariense]
MADDEETAKWDPVFTRQFKNLVGPLVQKYFRAEVNGLSALPSSGGALVVSNHSGGVLTPDVLIFAPAFYDAFGYDRPLYILAHYGVLMGPLGAVFSRAGGIEASRENAAKALHSGGVVLVFPGGDYDAFRPTRTANTIDFQGRTGYVRTALATDVPIVPVVSIGGQEAQLFLARGDRVAKRLGLHRIRLKALPLTFGVPFGLTTVLPPNLPLPTKIVMEVQQPIDVRARFGDDPDVDEVDAYVRGVMQAALDRLASKRRFPVLG